MPSHAQSELAQAMSDTSQQDNLRRFSIEAAAPSVAEAGAAEEQEGSLLPHVHAIGSAQAAKLPEAEGNAARAPVTLQYARSSPVQPGASRHSSTSVASRGSCEADHDSVLASVHAACAAQHSAGAALLALQPLLGTSPTFSASQQATQDEPYCGPFGGTLVRAITGSGLCRGAREPPRLAAGVAAAAGSPAMLASAAQRA